jgi:alpha-L-glutamate ligase-like protein
MFSLFKAGKELAANGVLGINARNLDYLFEHNNRKYYPQVDDKVLTKKLAVQAGITCPETYAIIEYQDQVRDFEALMGDRTDFVIKPAQGSGGEGILIITGKTDKGFVKASGEIISFGTVRYHLNNILGGLYSLGGVNDKAIIEYRVRSTRQFINISYRGVPDIRLIVYQGVPVMAMLRLPTQQSDGKANLHAGGIGVGVSIQKGITTYGVQHTDFIETHPDTGVTIKDIIIPDWERILELSSRFDSIIGLKYIGVDIVLDQTYGPMLLELNARPGIAIQIANRAGLKHRLQKVDQHIADLHIMEEKIAFAVREFS